MNTRSCILFLFVLLLVTNYYAETYVVTAVRLVALLRATGGVALRASKIGSIQNFIRNNPLKLMAGGTALSGALGIAVGEIIEDLIDFLTDAEINPGKFPGFCPFFKK